MPIRAGRFQTWHSIAFHRMSQLPQASRADIHVAFIGSAGVPNRYGGFEAFLEHCGPALAPRVGSVVVTCDASLYEDRSPYFAGMARRFIKMRANGAASIIHDLIAFITVYPAATHIVVLGVSGGPWFPLFRLACAVAGKRLLVNIDGIEWRRTKYSRTRRWLLRLFDAAAQLSAHDIIFDNQALLPFVLQPLRGKASLIAYSGDHVVRVGRAMRPRTALTICRIEPENNVDMLIQGVLASGISRYTVVGNWAYSDYGRALRAAHGTNPRLNLLDPIYDPGLLGELREQCSVYLHGHSVGGTNPSLVEMLFYDCRILCLDVAFHRETAGPCAEYFRDAADLSRLLAADKDMTDDRQARRRIYSRDAIADRYLALLTLPKGSGTSHA